MPVLSSCGPWEGSLIGRVDSAAEVSWWVAGREGEERAEGEALVAVVVASCILMSEL